jgi:NADH:ubiquinone oxidoreductase subunit 6 (subunit J)
MISLLTIIDYLVIGLVLSACFVMIFSKQMIHIFMAFLSILCIVAMIFLISGSGFLFATQLLLYLGGISVLLVFVIMLSKRLNKDKTLVSEHKNLIIGFCFTLVTFYLLIIALKSSGLHHFILGAKDEYRDLGLVIMSNYLFAFEILAVFLLIALVLSVVIAGKKQLK